MSDIIPEGILYGNLAVGSGTTNYNDLDNKPQINSVTLQGNKTASELGLVGTSDIPVTSVNGETGAVVLDGTDIEFSTGVSLNEKIIAVEQEIPVIAYPVTSVNGETGAVVLDGTDIEYSSGVSVNSQIDTLMQYIPVYNNTASGAIATFDTSLALPLQDLQIAINATKLIQTSGNDNTLNEFLRGLIKGTHNYADLGTVNWSYASSSMVFYSTFIDKESGMFNIICSKYPTSTATGAISNISDKEIRGQTGSSQIGFKDSSLPQEAGTKEALNNQYVIYELNSPITPTITTAQFKAICTAFGIDGDIYDLPVSPLPTTYQGTNNFFTDTNGNTSVVYACSLKDYIDGQ